MANRRASKYENAIVLKLTRANKLQKCCSCDKGIVPGDKYYRQSLGLLNRPPRVKLSSFCLSCQFSPLTRKLDLV